MIFDKMSVLLIAIILIAAIGLVLFMLWLNFKLRQQLRRDVMQKKPSENRFKTVFDSANDAILLYDPGNDRIIEFNAALNSLFGYAAEEIRHLNLSFLYAGEPPYSISDGKAKNAKALDGSPQTFEWLTVDSQGRKLWVEVSVKKVIVDEIPHLLMFIRAISVQKQTEARLYRLINIVDQIGEGVATADLNGIITYVNQAWADMHGYSPQTLLGKHLSMFHSDEQNINDVIPFNKKVAFFY